MFSISLYFQFRGQNEMKKICNIYYTNLCVFLNCFSLIFKDKLIDENAWNRQDEI